MSTVKQGDKVLVTGANGYVALWVVRTLLEKGYAVRGTIRSASKGEHLKTLFAEYKDKLELVVVEDITEEGAFDEAVKGVEAIAHTASPFHVHAKTPNELITPAVQGTGAILRSALLHGSSVKRIVITSSVVAVVKYLAGPEVFSEEDWNEQSIQMVKDDPQSVNGAIIYHASKTLAEKAAWDFVKENKSKINWDLAVLNPPYVYGPILQEIDSPAALNTSMKELYDTVLTPDLGGMSAKDLATTGLAWIDVRDLANAHVLALEVPEAGGERIIVSAGAYKWQDWVDAANLVPPSTLAKLANPALAKGNPGAGSPNPKTVHNVDFSTAKATKILGLKYISKEDSAKDMVEDFAKRGW